MIVLERHIEAGWQQFGRADDWAGAVLTMATFARTVGVPFDYEDADWFDSNEPKPGTLNETLPLAAIRSRETIDGRFRAVWCEWTNRSTPSEPTAP